MDAQATPERARQRAPGHKIRSSFVSQSIESYPLRFTGSGGEYFRVWIVNVLLSIITLGLYTPWARRRTAQYFYGQTLVAGSPLEFTAQQRRMVFGFIVLLTLSVAYQIAANTGQDLAVGLLALSGAALAPLIWGSAMRFRLSNTRWRGLRLQFTASWGEVYRASWPVFALALTWLAVFYTLQALVPPLDTDEQASHKLPQITAAITSLLALGLVLTLLCLIRLEFNYRSLLVLRTHIGDESGRWKPRFMDFVKLWLATVLVFVACALVLAGAAAFLLGGWWALLSGIGDGKPNLITLLFTMALFVAAVLALLLATAPARAYREAALFRLTWNNIGVSDLARFRCRLGVGAFVMLRLRNMLLTFITLGLFRPFARVSEYRMKLESVSLHVKGGIDHIAGHLARQQPGGVGDALADAIGLDLIG